MCVYSISDEDERKRVYEKTHQFKKYVFLRYNGFDNDI